MRAASATQDRSVGATITERITSWLFFAVFVMALTWVPYWYGSDRPIAWSINAMIFPGLAVLYEALLLIRGQRHPIAIWMVWPSALLFLMVLAWILLQNATWLPDILQHPIWTLSSDALGFAVPGSISVDRDLTNLALVRLLTTGSAFWLVLQLAKDPSIARWLIQAVSIIVAAYSLIGIAAFGLNADHGVFPEFGRVNIVSSTFFNRNTYATFAGMGIITSLGTVLHIYENELAGAGDLLRLRIALFISTTGGKAALPLALLFVNLAGLFMSASRGGIFATVAGVLLLGFLTLRSGKRHRLRTTATLVPIGLFLVAVFASFGGIFVSRLNAEGLLDEHRLIVQRLTIESILHSPWVGYGYGTFAAIFPMFRDNALGVWDVWDRAHNTYLEVLQGLGIPFGAALIVSVALLCYRCLVAVKSKRHSLGISSIAAAAACLVGVHAFTDFSLQVQAIPLIFMTILAAGVAQSMSHSTDYQSVAESKGRVRALSP